MDHKVPVGSLRRYVNLQELLPRGSPIPIDFVGQTRAQRALELALSSKESRFHVLVVAENKIPLDIIRKYIEGKLREWKQQGEIFTLSDICYVYNFKDPNSPTLLQFPAGEGSIFQQDVREIKENLQQEIPKAEQQILIKKEGLYRHYVSKANKLVEKLWEKFQAQGFLVNWANYQLGANLILNAETGMFVIQPGFLQNGQLITNDKAFSEFLKNASPETQICYYQDMQIKIGELSKKIHQIYTEHYISFEKDAEALEELEYTKTIDEVFLKYLEKYVDQKVKRFLEGLHQYVLTEIRDLFVPQYQQETVVTLTGSQLQFRQIPFEEIRAKMQVERDEDPMLPFEVNLLVNNGQQDLPPIVTETSPTYASLFGQLEASRMIYQKGENPTNHTKIRAGAFHKANNGFLILDLSDIFYSKPPVYLGLKRTLRENRVRIQEPIDEAGLTSPLKTLTPEPMPMELKVIAIVKPFLYYLLWHFPFDRELMEAFKVSAIFDNKVDGIPENLSAFASWMDEYAKNKEFFTLDPAAKAKILEHLFRVGGSQKRFACDVETIKSLIKESYFYALKDGSKRIKEQHVKKAVAEKIFRSNIIEEKIQEEIAVGRIKVELKGSSIGQINGVAVYTLDHYSFGIPTRITVNTYRGKDGVMSLQQQVALADKTLDLGVKKLESFFRQRYGREQTASLKATIAFEDYYESIGGPSASVAQLCALLSSLAEKPIRQDLAITGTVDQKGAIGVIGGVNEKIEGFYKSCKITGLTGTQGIIIPEKNQENLMLDEEVVEAVAKKKFHVYVADTIETAVELLMGCKMSEIDSLVEERLKSWAQ